MVVFTQIEAEGRSAGICVEDKGLVGRHCIVKLTNDVHSLRLDVRVPRGYPKEAAPSFKVLDSSLLAQPQLNDICLQMDSLAARRLHKQKTSLHKVFQHVVGLLSSLELAEEPLNLRESGDEGSAEGTAEENTRYPASCGHCWHPSGRFVLFVCYDMTEVRMETDDFFVDVKDKRLFRPDEGISSGEFELNPGYLAYYDPLVAQKPPRKSASSLFDFSDYLPLNRSFCTMLHLVGADLHALCEHNAEVCRKFSRPDYSRCWRVLGRAWRLFQERGDEAVLHPLGAPLVVRMIEHLLKLNDRAGALLLCVYLGLLLAHFLSAKGDTALLSSVKGEQSLLELLSAVSCLAQLLSRWGCHLQRAQILKLLWRVSAPAAWEASQRGLGYECEVGDVLDYPGTLVEGAGECSSCGASNLPCIVCQLPVKGLAAICRSCGHGGHLRHLKKWFAQEAACATGCGCQCQL